MVDSVDRLWIANGVFAVCVGDCKSVESQGVFNLRIKACERGFGYSNRILPLEGLD